MSFDFEPTGNILTFSRFIQYSACMAEVSSGRAVNPVPSTLQGSNSTTLRILKYNSSRGWRCLLLDLIYTLAVLHTPRLYISDTE